MTALCSVRHWPAVSCETPVRVCVWADSGLACYQLQVVWGAGALADGLVLQAVRRGRHGGPRALHILPAAGLDRRGELGPWRTRRNRRRHRLHPAAVRVRGPARVRAYRRCAALRHPHAGRDAAADRRRRLAGAHAGKAVAGDRGGAGRTGREPGDRAGADGRARCAVRLYADGAAGAGRAR